MARKKSGSYSRRDFTKLIALGGTAPLLPTGSKWLSRQAPAPGTGATISTGADTPFKLATFETGGRMRVGLLVGSRLYDAAGASAYLTDREKLSKVAVPGDMRSLIEQYERVRPRFYQIANYFASKADVTGPFAYDLAKARVKAPIMYPSNLLAIAANYRAHAEGMGAAGQRPDSGAQAGPTTAGFNANAASQIVPDRDAPIFFAKSPRSCVIGPGEPYYIPDGRDRTDWEGELAIVVGRRSYMVPRDRTHDIVFGYTIMYDVSDRGGKPRRQVTMFPGTNWFEGKSMDRAAPMGPFIVPKEFLPNANRLHLVTKVNGVVKQDANTSEMIWDEPHQIEYLTSMLTLYPADVISTGTPSGTGMERQEFLKSGDVVTIEIESIGTLTTPMKAQGDRVKDRLTAE